MNCNGRLNGLVLNEEGKEHLKQVLGNPNMKNSSEFTEALDSLCEQMNLVKGTISEEGQMSTCPVSYSLSSPNGFYATQVVGTVMGTPDGVVCYLMIVNTSPLLKTHTSAHIGRWCDNLQKWEFTNE
jgi:hypothetical protein